MNLNELTKRKSHWRYLPVWPFLIERWQWVRNCLVKDWSPITT